MGFLVMGIFPQRLWSSSAGSMIGDAVACLEGAGGRDAIGAEDRGAEAEVGTREKVPPSLILS